MTVSRADSSSCFIVGHLGFVGCIRGLAPTRTTQVSDAISDSLERCDEPLVSRDERLPMRFETSTRSFVRTLPGVVAAGCVFALAQGALIGVGKDVAWTQALGFAGTNAAL